MGGKLSRLISEQWDVVKNAGIDPSVLSEGSNQPCWWLCSQNHSFQAPVYRRVAGSSCPFCSNRKVLAGFNDLESLNVELARSWHRVRNELAPSEVTLGSNKKVWWLCDKGHEWQAVVAKRVGGQGCPFCSNKLVDPGVNDLATKFPMAALTWHPSKNGTVTPNKVTAGTGARFWWKCRNGHEWQAAFDRRRVFDGCAICNGVRVLPGVNDLFSKYPETRELWDFDRNSNIDASKHAVSSRRLIWWKCSNGHSWQAIAASVARSSKSGCPVCAGKRVLLGENDLNTTDPLIASQIFPLQRSKELAQSVTRGSDRKLSWQGDCGHVWLASVYSRTIQRTGCPVCSGNRVLSGFNDLAHRFPGLLDEWDYELNGSLDPSEVMSGANLKVYWRCKHKHRWMASIANRAHGRGCPQCRFSEPGVDDFGSLYPEMLNEWDFDKNLGIKPSELSRASGVKVSWVCDSGHHWDTTIANRTIVGTGCPSCATTGFKISLPSVLYFLEHAEFEARKVGITNKGTTRLSKFEKHGWAIVSVIGDESGQRIYDVEQATLRWLRLELGMTIKLMPDQVGAMGGWTETFGLDGPSNAEIIDFMGDCFENWSPST